MPLSPGEKLGPYEILAQLGEGGMGEVFEAKDSRLYQESRPNNPTTRPPSLAIQKWPAALFRSPRQICENMEL